MRTANQTKFEGGRQGQGIQIEIGSSVDAQRLSFSCSSCRTKTKTTKTSDYIRSCSSKEQQKKTG